MLCFLLLTVCTFCRCPLAACLAHLPRTRTALQGVHFGVFGLGNKQYEHFNAVGKAVHKALEQMGAVAVVRRGDGDDDGIIDDDFDKWWVTGWGGTW